LNGSIATPFDEIGFLEDISGVTTVAGFPAEFKLSIYKVSEITFVHKGDTILATVKAVNGEVTNNLSKIKFEINGGPIQLNKVKPGYFEFQVKHFSINVPPTEIKSIELETDGFAVSLRSGETLKGTINTDFLCGRTTAFGFPAEYQIAFRDIDTVAFHSQRSTPVAPPAQDRP